jgi:hypothetical protein
MAPCEASEYSTAHTIGPVNMIVPSPPNATMRNEWTYMFAFKRVELLEDEFQNMMRPLDHEPVLRVSRTEEAAIILYSGERWNAAHSGQMGSPPKPILIKRIRDGYPNTKDVAKISDGDVYYVTARVDRDAPIVMDAIASCACIEVLDNEVVWVLPSVMYAAVAAHAQ